MLWKLAHPCHPSPVTHWRPPREQVSNPWQQCACAAPVPVPWQRLRLQERTDLRAPPAACACHRSAFRASHSTEGDACEGDMESTHVRAGQGPWALTLHDPSFGNAAVSDQQRVFLLKYVNYWNPAFFLGKHTNACLFHPLISQQNDIGTQATVSFK